MLKEHSSKAVVKNLTLHPCNSPMKPYFSFPNLPKSSHLPTQCNFMFSLSLSRKKKKKEKKRKGGKKTSKKIFKKRSHTQHGIYSVLASYSWAWGPPWSVVHRHSIGETDFLFIPRHLLHMTSWLGWGFVSTSSLWGVSANMINRVSIHMRPEVQFNMAW